MFKSFIDRRLPTANSIVKTLLNVVTPRIVVILVHYAGSIPQSLGRAINLTYLDLSSNELTGEHQQASNLWRFHLKYLNTSNNSLVGESYSLFAVAVIAPPLSDCLSVILKFEFSSCCCLPSTLELTFVVLSLHVTLSISYWLDDVWRIISRVSDVGRFVWLRVSQARFHKAWARREI